MKMTSLEFAVLTLIASIGTFCAAYAFGLGYVLPV